MFDWFKRLAALSALALVAACGGGDDDPHPGNIVQIAQADARFSILAEAVVAADLATTLAGPGPFTVFAPTNDAFAALLTELGLTKAQLLADKPLLTAVLQYHVLSGTVRKAAVRKAAARSRDSARPRAVTFHGSAMPSTMRSNSSSTLPGRR